MAKKKITAPRLKMEITPEEKLLNDALKQLRKKFEKSTFASALYWAGYAAATKKKNKQLKELLIWLLGYTDFPQRKEGEGAYYWRKHLRKKLKEQGIEIV